jgi:two-component system chemotaxis response regulator CheY
MRETLKRYLDPERFEIFEAKNGIEAVETYLTVNPHIVTMDITMPEMDGKEALIKIKEYDKSAVIMMCTALGQETYVKECLKYGCANYIIKPFTGDVYKEKVEDLVKRAVLAKKCPYEKDCNGCGYSDICRVEK